MSDTLWLAIIGLVALAIKEYADYHRSVKTNAKVEVIHKATNSLKDELVEAVRKSATLAGEKIGRDAEQKRVKESAPESKPEH